MASTRKDIKTMKEDWIGKDPWSSGEAAGELVVDTIGAPLLPE